MRVGEAIVALLHEHYGVDVIFGIPGVHNIELYRGLSTSGVRAISPRHEQGAGFMADGYAIATGRPGVCMLITGPGLTNALTPMGQAYHDSRPMLVLAATTPTTDLGKGHGPLHDISDQAAIARPVTAFSTTVMEPSEVPALLARAYDVFHIGRPRPVHLALPTDVLAMDTAGYQPIITIHQPPTFDAAAVSEAAAALRAAHRPMIVAGGGSVGAADEVRVLAEQLGATVVLTGNAKGVLPSSHPLCAGNTLSNATTQRLLAEADCVLVVGAEVSDADIWNGGTPLPLATDGT
ncbi:MAG: thiamine pyrophosphate-binding protein, partial [Ilumatobacteraceae bacterium]